MQNISGGLLDAGKVENYVDSLLRLQLAETNTKSDTTMKSKYIVSKINKKPIRHGLGLISILKYHPSFAGLGDIGDTIVVSYMFELVSFLDYFLLVYRDRPIVADIRLSGQVITTSFFLIA